VNPKDPSLMNLILTREEIDNPHKERTWDIYTDKFTIKVATKRIR
jgi:hypothetical protein